MFPSSSLPYEFCTTAHSPLIVLPLDQAWIAAGDDSHGFLYSAGCTDCMLPSCNKREIIWDPDIDPDMEHPVRAIFGVQYGKLWLADGWTGCGSIIDSGAKFIESETLLQSFALTQNVKTINCIIRYLMFQGLPNTNVVKASAESRMPKVQLTIAPTCRDIPPSCEGGSGASNNILCTTPASRQACADAGGTCVDCTCNPDPDSLAGPFCGAPFAMHEVSTTYLHLAERNDIPFLDSCPRMYLHPRDHAKDGSSLAWYKADSRGYCDGVRLTPKSSAHLLPSPPLQTTWTMPFLNTPQYPRADVLAGTDVMPRLHRPTQCASLMANEPFCNQFSTKLPSCKVERPRCR